MEHISCLKKRQQVFQDNLDIVAKLKLNRLHLEFSNNPEIFQVVGKARQHCFHVSFCEAVGAEISWQPSSVVLYVPRVVFHVFVGILLLYHVSIEQNTCAASVESLRTALPTLTTVL